MPQMPTNPFTYGGPITNQTRFIGRVSEVDQILTRLGNTEGESTSVVGERRIGKTSLLKHLTHASVRAPYGLDSNAYTFVYTDLQLLSGSSTPDRLWRRLLRITADNCQSTTVARLLSHLPTDDPIDAFMLDDVFETVDRLDHHIVLLLDEFDCVTRNPHFGPDFFTGLRGLAINHCLSLVTSSQRHLIELCHSPEVRSSPFFNIFATVHLRPLSDGDAVALIQSGLTDTGVAFDDSEMNLALNLSGGHPFLLQLACHLLYRAHNDPTASNDRLTPVRDRFIAEAANHFAIYWHTSDDSERIVLTVFAILNRSDGSTRSQFRVEELRSLYSQTEPALTRLEQRGLVIVESGKYELFSALFAQWTLMEIAATLTEQQSYQQWLDSRARGPNHLSVVVGSELGEILPRIRVRYRDMLVAWVSNPSNVASVVKLLRNALDSFHGWPQ
jgi:hypothetical protein